MFNIVWFDNQYQYKHEDGTYTVVLRNPKVERILSECLKLWDNYLNPEAFNNRRVDRCHQDNTLLIALCSEVEEAINHLLNDRDKEMFFDFYAYGFEKTVLTRKHGLQYAVRHHKLTAMLLRVAAYLELLHRWDTLGNDTKRTTDGTERKS